MGTRDVEFDVCYALQEDSNGKSNEAIDLIKFDNDKYDFHVNLFMDKNCIKKEPQSPQSPGNNLEFQLQPGVSVDSKPAVLTTGTTFTPVNQPFTIKAYKTQKKSCDGTRKLTITGKQQTRKCDPKEPGFAQRRRRMRWSRSDESMTQQS